MELSKEARDPLEGLAFAVLGLVALVCGVLLGAQWQATAARMTALESRMEASEKWQSEADKVLGIGGE